MASITTTYPTMISAIADALHDSNLKVLDKFTEYLVERIGHTDVESFKGYVDEFKKQMNAEHDVECKKMKKTSKPTKVEKKKRAPTGYSLFVGMQMKKIKEENPNMPGTEVMTQAMKYWSSLTPEEKSKYSKEAKDLVANEKNYDSDSGSSQKTVSSVSTVSTVEETPAAPPPKVTVKVVKTVKKVDKVVNKKTRNVVETESSESD